MKQRFKSLLLVVLSLGMTIPAWSQASTEGKDFWVANTIICQPPTASKAAFPTIAVSAQKACAVTIEDYAGNTLATANVAAGSWTRFGDNTATVDPADYYLDPSKWYPTTDNVNATDAYKHADKINNYGLHITATENVSVFVIMRTPQYSMDASNTLPVSALQSEYYLQDFYPDANGVDKPVTMTTILAIEDNTQVDITPKGNTYGKTNNGTTFTVTLNKGQTYYLISEKNAQLAGTHIVAKDGKKIAVYVGSPVTRLPDGVSARDGLFEQMMPVDYWGTQFIATRSMQKDGNFIGITATQNGTELKIDGYTQTYINEGETYYILLQGAANPYDKNKSKITHPIDQVITADAAYIETSCPCAVISYDTGNSFAGSSNSEIVNGQGDPSSVWLSPLQQKINRITFGACYTKMTKAHFLNVVTETATCSNTKLTAYMGQYGNDWSNKLVWTPVPGNTKYSYARVQIGNNTETINVFTLENPKGFIAHVYGNGEDESYAYSAGSAAVEQGVNVNGVTFTNGYRSNEKFCIMDSLAFDAKVGTDEVTRVDWDFGDGTTDYNGEPQTKHQYAQPGWYNVTADLRGHQVCTDDNEKPLGKVSFIFRVVRADTVVIADHDCINPDSTLHGKKLTAAEVQDLLTNGIKKSNADQRAHCYDSVVVTYTRYGMHTEEELDTVVGKDVAYSPYNGKAYYISQDVVDTLPNADNCYLFRRYYVHVLTCLDFKVPNNPASQHVCPGNSLTLTYSKFKGDVGKVRFVVPGKIDEPITIDPNALAGPLVLPIQSLKPGVYKGQLLVEDKNCDDLTIDIDFTVYYPSTIFAVKYNNVLAVYKKGYGDNDGYDFVEPYQWYVNGQLMAGATQSVYHHYESFKTGDEVYVVLTTANGVSIPSCPQTIGVMPDFTPQPSASPALKVMQNNRMVIKKDGMTFDMYGQRVQ